MNRRRFLKIFGTGIAAITIAPKIIIEALEQRAYDFIPGEMYRNAVGFPRRIESMTSNEKKDVKDTLDNWLKKKIHPDYLDLNKVEYMFKNMDLKNSGGIGVQYIVPKRPIIRRQTGRMIWKKRLCQGSNIGTLLVSRLLGTW